MCLKMETDEQNGHHSEDTNHITSETKVTEVKVKEEEEDEEEEVVKEELDFEILSAIYDIIRCFERDLSDAGTKLRESQECSQKVNELNKRLDKARAAINELPGIDCSKEEQLERVKSMRKQIQLKEELILKYKKMKF